MVSARRLRKSSLNQDYNINLDFLDFDNEKINKIKLKKYNNDNNNENFNYYSFKNKLSIKFFICSFILFICVITKILFLDEFKSNTKAYRIYEHYKFDFSKQLVLENFEDYLIKKEYIIDNIIPDRVKNIIVDKYVNNIKKYLINFSFLNLFDNNNNINIYNDIDVYNKNLGIGGFEPLDCNNKTVKKEIKKVDKEVNDKKYSFINPTKGIITSRFGNRPVIFKGVNPYHTGIDIANKEGTDIVSVSDGKVIETVYNNKFYGNYIVIEFNEYKFKYAHLKEILVNKNDKVKQGKIIAKMGNTGLSTGPHLHFEVILNDIKINPEEKFRF